MWTGKEYSALSYAKARTGQILYRGIMMRKLILELTRSPAVRKTATALGLHSAVNWWLARIFLEKKL